MINRVCLMILIAIAALHYSWGQTFPKFVTSVNLDTIQLVRDSWKMYRYADISRYRKAMEVQGGYAVHRQFEHTLNSADSQRVNELKQHDAIEYILEKARNEKIIIINEMHHVPQHRVFTKSLLRGLHKIGFNHLCLEGLSNDPHLDSILQKDKYIIQIPEIPLRYIEGPQFAEMVRLAFELNYQVRPYSMTHIQREKRKTIEDRKEKRLFRDRSMAENIQLILERNPDARLLIHCGYAHAIESIQDRHFNLGKSKWLAAFIKELTGIDPLTIDQTILSEKDPYPNNPFYEMKRLDTAAIFEDAYGIPFRPNTCFHVDLFVWHPPNIIENGRSQWLLDQQEYLPYKPEIINVPTFPFLTLAQYTQESPDGVPIDVIEIRDQDDIGKMELVLRKGFNYHIYSKDVFGNAILQQEIFIEP